ncbi:MAG: NAD(P)/FAD-dependent oxidoreductase [Deltaproteobacteria bacterium]|nr:NAD(P)/FAD-dependent oxidoreductase [Deltaproteobacteria bacterium]
MTYDDNINGAGAAGHMSAITAGSRGKKVLLLEANAKPGMKILISGGGRCNFTNLGVTPSDYVSENSHFCTSALSQFTQHDFIAWIQEAGIPFYEKTLGQLFCTTSSKEIVHFLLNKASDYGVLLKTAIKVTDIRQHSGQFSITDAENEVYTSKNLIIATGGLSFPNLGASDFGYRIAQQFGHVITPLNPALDGFVFSENDRKRFSNLAGISLEVTLTAGKRSFTENILFTHVGMSGPAALKGSLYWHKGRPIMIDFLPTIANFSALFREKQHELGKKGVVSFLNRFFPERFSEIAANACLVHAKKVADISNDDLRNLETWLKQFSCVPLSTVGYDKAEVTRGGVDTKDLSSKTLESKLVPGLFFVGEVVDVTGLLGGYNFQWAWSSGWVAGQNIY